MNPISLQKQIRDNTNDLASFCADLKQWGEEMKQKDESLKEGRGSTTSDVPLVRNKTKKHSKLKEDKLLKGNDMKSSKRIKGSDYSAWEKFDADAECAKLDKLKSDNDDYEDSSELTDECDESIREEAINHKEKGNKYVKKGNLNQAIECYTKAIECYAYDPVFYGNRALCHLKNLDYRLAESDCTTAIQLDKTYVKAYHRRALAREALNQLNEAHDDLLKVFDYEPDNKESKIALTKLEKKLESVAKEVCARTNDAEQRPKSKFTLSRQQQKILPQNKAQKLIKTDSMLISNGSTLESTNASYWPSGNNIELIKTINKAPHLRSKKPLKRINISETDSIMLNQDKVKAQPLPSLTSDNSVIKCDDFKVVERKVPKCDKIELPTPNINKYIKEAIPEKQNSEQFCFVAPETSVQFNYDWRLIKDKPDWQYMYLKQVHPKKLKSIFNESLECDIFTGIIYTLADKFIEKNTPVHEHLMGLAEVKRFNMLVMFMNDSDKKELWRLVDYMRSNSIPGDIVDNIITKYDL